MAAPIGIDSRLAYTALVGLVAIERFVEVYVSKRNVRRALGRGGIEDGPAHYKWMVGFHAALLVACPLEVWVLARPWVPALGLPMLGLLAGANVVRLWVMATLGDRWTTRVVYVPGDPLVTGGPFRWMRHPNYLAVVVEVAALPLIHTAWLTAALASIANGFVLRRRIAIEDGILKRLAGPPPPAEA
jgi:methyltransferase